MKNVVYILVTCSMVLMCSCVNDALLKSAKTYQVSTEPYLNYSLKNMPMEDMEREALLQNIEQFKKTIEKMSDSNTWGGR